MAGRICRQDESPAGVGIAIQVKVTESAVEVGLAHQVVQAQPLRQQEGIARVLEGVLGIAGGAQHDGKEQAGVDPVGRREEGLAVDDLDEQVEGFLRPAFLPGPFGRAEEDAGLGIAEPGSADPARAGTVLAGGGLVEGWHRRARLLFW